MLHRSLTRSLWFLSCAIVSLGTATSMLYGADRHASVNYSDTKFGELSFNAVELRSAFQFIEDSTDISIRPDWAELERIGIKPDMSVTVSTKNVPLDKVLDAILTTVAGDKEKPLFSFEDNFVVITSRAAADSKVETRTYDVSDLIITPVDMHPADIDDATRDELMAEVISLITSTIDPESWKKPPAKIEHKRTELIVTATRERHRQLANLFDKLRGTRAIQIVLDMRLITVDAAAIAPKTLGFDPLTATPRYPKAAALDDKQLKTLLGAVRNAKQSKMLLLSRRVVYAGERQIIKSGVPSHLLVGFTNDTQLPVHGEIILGTQLSVVPTISADRKIVKMEVHYRETNPHLSAENLFSNIDLAEKLKVQPKFQQKEFRETMAMPDGLSRCLELSRSKEGSVTLLHIRPQLVLPKLPLTSPEGDEVPKDRD